MSAPSGPPPGRFSMSPGARCIPSRTWERRGPLRPRVRRMYREKLNSYRPEVQTASEKIRDVRRTTCCVVGGGPGGAVLSLLLARAGVDVTLLDAHPDFDREFRGDTLHPSVMEIMGQLGLSQRLLEVPRSELRNFTLQTVS